MWRTCVPGPSLKVICTLAGVVAGAYGTVPPPLETHTQNSKLRTQHPHLRPEILLEGDLHVADVVAVPPGAKHGVGKAHDQHVLLCVVCWVLRRWVAGYR